MPVIVRVLLNGLSTLAQLAFGASSSGVSSATLAAYVSGLIAQISQIVSMLASFAGIFDSLANKILASWQYADPRMKDLALGVGNLGYVERDAWERLFTVIIPGSLSWLDGRTHQWVDAKYDWQINDFWNYWHSQWKWDDEVTKWADNWVDPNLEHWIVWFNTWHQRVETVAFTWTEWFKHPDEFGDWGAPPLIGPTIDYYSKPEHKDSRDNMTQIIVDATADMPNHVEGAIMAWLTSDSGQKGR